MTDDNTRTDSNHTVTQITPLGERQAYKEPDPKRKNIVIDTELGQMPVLFLIGKIGANIGYLLSLMLWGLAGISLFGWIVAKMVSLTGSTLIGVPLGILTAGFTFTLLYLGSGKVIRK
jgi:hypothetical protein